MRPAANPPWFAPGVRLIDKISTAYARGSEHPAKGRVLRALLRRYNPRPQIILPSGAKFSFDPTDYIGWSILTTGCYEPLTLGLAMDLLVREPGLVVDVGANAGLFTCTAAALNGSRVVAIDPDPVNGAALRDNIALNGFHNVSIFSGGCSDRDELVPIRQRTPGNAGTIAIASGSEAVVGPRNWIFALTLSRILESLETRSVRPVLVKMDIEGYEPVALRGIDWSDRWRPGNIIFEYNAPAWGSFHDVADFFAQRNYRLFNVVGDPLTCDVALLEDNIWASDASVGV